MVLINCFIVDLYDHFSDEKQNTSKKKKSNHITVPPFQSRLMHYCPILASNPQHFLPAQCWCFESQQWTARVKSRKEGNLGIWGRFNKICECTSVNTFFLWGLQGPMHFYIKDKLLTQFGEQEFTFLRDAVSSSLTQLHKTYYVILFFFS